MPPKKQSVESTIATTEPVAATKAKKPVAKKSKASSSTPDSSAASVPPPPPTPASTPASTTASTPATTPPATTPPATTPPATTPPATTPPATLELASDAVITPPVEDVQLETLKEFAEFHVKFAALRTNISNLMQDFKQLQKKTERDLKNAQKSSNKRKRKTGVRQPSGFVKPTLISHELADFLSRERGSELARTEVTREINAYIRANNLQDPSNGRRILADDKLKKLLSLTSTDELTYFNLQKFMSPHFQKLGGELINGPITIK
jgi:upstream activation factor subunit UAF30